MNIVVVQMINYTLSFLMWMIVGRGILELILGNRQNIMLLAFVKITEPVYGVTRTFTSAVDQQHSSPDPPSPEKSLAVTWST